MDMATLLKVIGVDLVLSGDNAIVIALAARNVPAEHRRKAIFWGTLGAIVLRLLFAAIIVWLLKIPLISALGGILLIQIAYSLLAGKEKEHKAGGETVASAVRTIIIADAVMSLDNVLALAGVAHGFVPILIGILISIPIIVWGSQLILKVMERFPVIVYAGAGLLAYTSGEMIVGDQMVDEFLHSSMPNLVEAIHVGLPILLVILVVGIGYLRRKQNKKDTSNAV
ncbi:TerC family protein [Peribacillus cavernae]|uniref:TerC family protein n=1 Tax=Peribacillus cavernae TaxID=1674310 RepID=A0A3S0TX42_9BACI|nr:TerC family protein [Peribacillus cavernae]RUQ26002.1 TerC family protein [Peribacillus cavernae]